MHSLIYHHKNPLLAMHWQMYQLAISMITLHNKWPPPHHREGQTHFQPLPASCLLRAHWPEQITQACPESSRREEANAAHMNPQLGCGCLTLLQGSKELGTERETPEQSLLGISTSQPMAPRKFNFCKKTYTL